MPWRLLSVTIVLGAALAACQARAFTFEDSLANGGAPAVPEPGAALLFGAGLVLVGRARRQRSRT